MIKYKNLSVYNTV